LCKALDDALGNAWSLQGNGNGRHVCTVLMLRGLFDVLPARHAGAARGSSAGVVTAAPRGLPLSAGIVGALFKRYSKARPQKLEKTLPGAAMSLRCASTRWL